MSNTTNTAAASGAEDLQDVVSKALRRAWQLGQTYWRQADSDSYRQNKQSGETQAVFVKLVDETRAALASPAQAAALVSPSDDGFMAAVNEMDGLYAAPAQAVPAPGTPSDAQIMASAGRCETSMSDSRPLGQQWTQVCNLVRTVIRERCATTAGYSHADVTAAHTAGYKLGLAQRDAAPAQAGEYPAGTGNPEADRIIGRLASSDPDFDDCADAVALIHKLVAEIKGPDGFDTWKDAAIADRAAHRVAQAAPVGMEPVYQIGQPFQGTWRDASKDVYDVCMPSERRIIYTASQTAAVQQDAERYRWLRKYAIGAYITAQGNGSTAVYLLTKAPALDGIGEETDAAIDAARAAQKEAND